MQILKYLTRTILVLALLTLPLAWLACTNSGLRAVLGIAQRFSPYKFEYGAVEGKIIGTPIILHDLNVTNNGNILEISLLRIDWQMRKLSAKMVRGFEPLLPYADWIVQDKATAIEQIDARLNVDQQSLNLHVNLSGKWQKVQLNSVASVTKINNEWTIDYAILHLGKNTLTLKNGTNSYSWYLNLLTPELIFKESLGAIQANGNIQHLATIPQIQAKIVAAQFKIKNYSITNLEINALVTPDPKAPLKIIGNLDKLKIDDNEVGAIKVNLQGTLEKHSLSASANYSEYAFKISANGYFDQHIWRSDNLLVKCNTEQLQGSASYDLQSTQAVLDLNGKLFDIPSKLKLASDINKQNHTANFVMQANKQNHLHADVTLKSDKLSGQLNLLAEDLGLIMRWIPDMTRLKGILTAKATLNGTLQNPAITAEAHLTHITATFPSMGIKVKPMELHLHGDQNGKYILTGKGKMRRGSGDFTISGFVEPFKPNFPNKITVVGNKVEFINNADAHLIASNNLNFVYDVADDRLDITGDIDVLSGNIYFDYKKPSNVKSKDVVFINEPELIQQKFIKINPDVHVRIEDGIQFSGYGLDAVISGKLDVSHRHDALYADGRVTIKDGTFQLPGQKLQIQKGRLLYPPGTLLANPMLDIKMLGKNQIKGTASESEPDLELVVQGTAQAPTISASGLASNSDKALSQALLTGSSVLSNNLLQDKLKLSEIGIVSKDEQTVDFFDNPGKGRGDLKNKDFVIGRPLGNKVYIQYLQSMGDNINKRLRVKYSLSKHWAIGVESGDQGGGADLSFTYEKD